MAKRVRRKNEKLLVWLRAFSMTALTLLPLWRMHFQPEWGAVVLAIAVGALTLIAVDIGVLAAIIVVSLPVMASNVLLGAAFLVLGIAVTRFVGSDGSQAYLLLATAIVGAFLGPVWAAPVIAGYLLGSGEGAVAAVVTCVAVELIGLLMGPEVKLVGTVATSTIATASTGAAVATTASVAATGTPSALLTFTPVNMFSLAWVKDSFGAFGPGTLTTLKDYLQAYLVGTKQLPILLAQPVVWAGAAALTGALTGLGRKRKVNWLSLVAVLAGTAVTAIGASVVVKMFGGAVAPVGIFIGFVTSVIAAGIVVLLLDRVFTRQVLMHKKRSPMTSMAAEDADVDELLRLISTAEERLASEHTTSKVVMITDMKSFSRMTEEDGSVLTAKAIQKHRDLLLPIVQKHEGHGKSTGGDGLVAAFDSPAQAVGAAAEMQQALHAYNDTHPDDREMFVRIGIADGEIVLDKGGRPFLGAALNLAARVMNLADGGQAFVTASVAERAGAAVKFANHGDFELKNISKPVQVMEILWAPDQVAVDPRTREV